MWDVVVVGAGAAGLLAASRAAERGLRTLLLEKNRKPGVKILMSGGTRCNITQATDVKGIIAGYGQPGKFLHSALAALSPQGVVELFHDAGVPTKVESTGKIFPASDKALDVQQALLRRLAQSGAELQTGIAVVEINKCAGEFEVRAQTGAWQAANLLLTTGGMSYPGCGTTGDGYVWAQALGHSIVPPKPALVPITCPAEWVRGLSGVTLPDVAVRILSLKGAQSLAQDRGSLLFTHFGFSGPVVLNVSRAVSGHPNPTDLSLQCDLMPGVSDSTLQSELQQAAQTRGNQAVLARWTEYLPRRIVETLFQLAEVPVARRFSEFSKAERNRLIDVSKRLRVPVSGTLGFEKAEVTAGGVSLDEIDSRTMQSRLVPHLYFAGEILNLDGPIGGYNFQAAFSTGWLAGSSIPVPPFARPE